MPKRQRDQSVPKSKSIEPSGANSISESTKNNDAAFRLATLYNVPVKEAIEVCRASCGASGLYSKVKRWRDRQRNRSGEEKDVEDSAALTPPPVQIEELVKDYAECSNRLTSLGFNGGVLDLEPRPVQEDTLPADEEAAVEELVKNKGMNKAGSLFRAGVIMANSRVVLEAAKRVSLQAEKEKENASRKREEREEQLILDGVSAFRRWVAHGRLFLEEDGHKYPTLPRKDAIAIVRVLLPRIDIKGEMKMKDLSTAKACIKCLGKIGRGTTWDEEMLVFEGKVKDDGLEGRSL